MHTRHRLWETGRCGLVWGAVVLSVAGAASSAPGQTFIHGVDVSLWQGAIDWNSVKAAGNEYAFIRSTRGEGYKDPLFLANMRAATAAGLMVGPYHFCRLETNYLDPNDAVAEANHFLSVIKPYYDAGQMLPPVADVEGFPDFPNTATARAYVSAWTQTFSDTIYDALGVRPIVYGSLWTSNNYYTPAIASTHDLWLAWWKTSGMDNPPTAADTPAWGPWTFWQWTATGSVAGINGNVDRDLFNGDMLQLESLLHGQGPRGGLPGGYTVITDFDGADFDSPESHGIEGYFMNSPTYSGSTNGVVPATTTATRSTLHAQNGPASQRLFVDSTGGAWTVRHVSGIGATPATPAANLPLEAVGSIGFWLMTTDPGITVQLLIDDPTPASPTAIETSTVKNVVADGQWHLYEWQFTDAAQWNNYAGGGNGVITNAVVTIDSIVFKGNGDATIFLDTVAHNPDGSLAPLVGDFNADWRVDAADLALWQQAYGAGAGGDADGNGQTDGADLLLWQRNLTAASAAAAAQPTPEPAAAALAAAALAALAAATRRPRVVDRRGAAA